MTALVLLSAGFCDLLLGDPRGLPHPVRWIGRLTATLEKALYPINRSDRGEFLAGCIVCAAVIAVCGGAAFIVPASLRKWSPVAGFIGETITVFYCLSARSLVQEADKVRNRLAARDLPAARNAVAMIVGRDTGNLDERGIVRATVETVAENIVDGIVAPVFWFAVGGPVAAVVFKAVSTMDSMIGYKSERYRRFGTAAARLDDVLNFIPARLTAFFFIPGAALLLRYNWQQSLRIVKRDRRKHDSPNSAHGEAAVAGALGVQLGGEAFYRGVPSCKPLLGNRQNLVQIGDITRACRIAAMVTLLVLVFFSLLMMTCSRLPVPIRLPL